MTDRLNVDTRKVSLAELQLRSEHTRGKPLIYAPVAFYRYQFIEEQLWKRPCMVHVDVRGRV